jgi:hypothetical protein
MTADKKDMYLLCFIMMFVFVKNVSLSIDSIRCACFPPAQSRAMAEF